MSYELDVAFGLTFCQGSIAEAKSETKSETLAQVRRARRRRKLEQVEISEDQVIIFEDELLGKGGFGEVYLAEYNTRNAAAKVRLYLVFFIFFATDQAHCACSANASHYEPSQTIPSTYRTVDV